MTHERVLFEQLPPTLSKLHCCSLLGRSVSIFLSIMWDRNGDGKLYWTVLVTRICSKDSTVSTVFHLPVNYTVKAKFQKRVLKVSLQAAANLAGSNIMELVFTLFQKADDNGVVAWVV